jgi:type I restriction enzyme M protein
MKNHSEITNFIWSVADLLRDAFKRGKYQDIILPLTVLRRIDCVLEPTKGAVLTTYNEFKGKLDDLSPQLTRASGYAFYNTSPFTFPLMLADAHNLGQNLRSYINHFSDNMREVIEKFDFENTISKLESSGLLYQVLERFKNIDLHPDVVSNHDMGYIFEDLIRLFNEALNENPGEHFTPREVIRLMVKLLLEPDKELFSDSARNLTIYDPCCGSGGMLTIGKETIEEINPGISVFLFGQEVNPETYAMCKSDLYIKSKDGKDGENIQFGSTLSNDRHSRMRFNYQLTNPPYGKEWKQDKDAVEREAEKGFSGRFGAGLPRISDGQLLFLQHMLGRMKPLEEGGGRIAIIMNGSPLFTGDAGGGESEIRRWILENDYLEALIAMPEQLFYNTGIATYVWILSNRKEPKRMGKVQLINASGFWVPMRKSLGDKRREISAEQIDQITAIYTAFEEGVLSKIFNTSDFGYRRITVERPLRLNFQATPERIELLKSQAGFINLAVSKQKEMMTKEREEVMGREYQQKVIDMLCAMTDTPFKDRNEFEKALSIASKESGTPLSPPLRKAILAALSEQDETAAICMDGGGHPEADTELRDTENVPLGEDIWEYFEREVKPHVPDAWVNKSVVDIKDGTIGKIGYELNFNRYFYKYVPPRSLEEIESDIQQLEKEFLEMLREVAG